MGRTYNILLAVNLAMILLGRIVAGWAVGLLSMSVPVYQAECAHHVIAYNQTILYRSLGITGSRNVLVAGIYNIVGPVANLIFIVFFLDRSGRKKPLLYGAVGITIALVCEAVLNSQNPDGSHTGLSIAAVFFIFMVSVIFSTSFGPISWVYMSEVMPMQIRGRGSAFATGLGNWLVATFWAQISPIAHGSIKWKFYFVFVAWNVLVTIPVIWLFFKETKQKSLEEIDMLFGERALGPLPDKLDNKDMDEAMRRQSEAPGKKLNVQHVDVVKPRLKRYVPNACHRTRT